MSDQPNESTNNNPNPTDKPIWDYTPNGEGAIPIPVKVAKAEDIVDDTANLGHQGRLGNDSDQIVREYEQRYQGQEEAARNGEQSHAYYHDDRPRKRKNDDDSSIWGRAWSNSRNYARRYKVPPAHRYPTRPRYQQVSDDERLWAALAHGSAIFTFIIMVSTGFLGVVLSVLIPMGIYLAFRNRSQFVAFHAMQAFTMQVVGTIGALALALAGTFVLVPLIVVSAIFSIVLIGIPFLLFFIALLLLVWLASLGLTLLMVIYGVIAAFAAWNGSNYRYPYVADWVDDQLHKGFLRHIA